MKLILYKCSDSPNTINKVKTAALEVDGLTLRRGVDVSNPVLRIAIPENVYDYNYAEIDELYRYYFIDRIESVTSELWELHLTCDVLETYASDVLNSNARFLRNIEPGDYQQTGLQTKVKADISVFNSDKELSGGPSMILTTLGSGD